jgi:hypothetical protein
MAIKIAGTTVIDDSRNVCNICTVSATTVCATSFAGTGADSLVGELYQCAIACANITAGDPLASICGVSVTPVTGDPGYCCLGVATPVTCIGSIARTNDIVAVKFGCSQNCFATVQYISPIAVGCVITSSSGCCLCTQDGAIQVNAYCVSSSGTMSQATCVCTYTLQWCTLCYGCNPPGVNSQINTSEYLIRKPIAVSSCSGSKSDVILCRQSFWCTCGNGSGSVSCARLSHIRLCFCTTTCTVSIVCFCCASEGAVSNCERIHFVTPDAAYFMTLQVCKQSPSACSDMWSVNAKIPNDSACYISFPAATITCGCSFQSFLPATCAMFATSIPRITTSVMSPFEYGTDGWMVIWANVCCNPADSYDHRYAQRIIAVKPTGDNTVLTSRNIICPTSATCACFPYWCSLSQGSQGCDSLLVRAFDQGDGVKRHLFHRSFGDTTEFCLVCLRVCNFGGNCNDLTWVGTRTSGSQTISSIASCYSSTGIESWTYVRQFQQSCWGTLGVAQGITGSCLLGLPLGMYMASAPLCSACSCYLFTGPCRAIWGGVASSQACNFWAGGSDSNTSDGSCTCLEISSYRLAFANTVPESFCYCAPSAFAITIADVCRINPIMCVLLPVFTLCMHQSNKVFCRCLDQCPKTFNYSPIVLHDGAVVVSASNGQHSTCICLCAGNCRVSPYVISYARASCINNNQNCFIGIAQNTVSAGGIARIAVPGMVDRSNTVGRFFASCDIGAGPICIGARRCNNGCVCATPETQTLLGIGWSCNFIHYPNYYVTFKTYCDCRCGRLTTIGLTNACTCS